MISVYGDTDGGAARRIARWYVGATRLLAVIVEQPKPESSEVWDSFERVRKAYEDLELIGAGAAPRLSGSIEQGTPGALHSGTGLWAFAGLWELPAGFKQATPRLSRFEQRHCFLEVAAARAEAERLSALEAVHCTGCGAENCAWAWTADPRPFVKCCPDCSHFAVE